MKLTLTIDDGRKLDILIHKDETIDKLIEVFYPTRNRESKGYVTLVNFFFKESN